MLKKEMAEKTIELQRELKEANGTYRQMSHLIEEKEKEIEFLKHASFRMEGQLKQLSQSIYTMIQVKFPEQYTCEPREIIDQGEEHRFLLLLHGLCADNHRGSSIRGFDHLIHS